MRDGNVKKIVQSRRACVPVATAVTRYVNALPDVSITQTNIGQVMRDATEFPVLAYRVDQREFMESSSCFFVTEGRPASMHVQFKGSEPHENIKIKKICSHEKSQNQVHEKSQTKIRSFPVTDVRMFTKAVSTKNQNLLGLLVG